MNKNFDKILTLPRNWKNKNFLTDFDLNIGELIIKSNQHLIFVFCYFFCHFLHTNTHILSLSLSHTLSHSLSLTHSLSLSLFQTYTHTISLFSSFVAETKLSVSSSRLSVKFSRYILTLPSRWQFSLIPRFNFLWRMRRKSCHALKPFLATITYFQTKRKISKPIRFLNQ